MLRRLSHLITRWASSPRRRTLLRWTARVMTALLVWLGAQTDIVVVIGDPTLLVRVHPMFA